MNLADVSSVVAAIKADTVPSMAKKNDINQTGNTSTKEINDAFEPSSESKQFKSIVDNSDIKSMTGLDLMGIATQLHDRGLMTDEQCDSIIKGVMENGNDDSTSNSEVNGTDTRDKKINWLELFEKKAKEAETSGNTNDKSYSTALAIAQKIQFFQNS